MKSLFRNFFGAHCLAVCCAFALNGNAEAQTFDDYNGKTVVFGAKYDGTMYAMNYKVENGGRLDKIPVSLNAEKEIVYLTTENEQNKILWNIGGRSDWVSIISAYNNKYLGIKNGTTLESASSLSNDYKWAFNKSRSTFTYNSGAYGIILFSTVFLMQEKSFFNTYPIAKPYFLAEHTWRTLGSSNFGTICFPKAVRADEVAGATFYEIAAKIVDNGKFKGVVLNEVTGDLAAGTPYIFKRASDATYIVAAMHGDAAEATSHNGLVGTLTVSAEDGGFEVPAGMYILQGDQLWLTTTGQSRLLAGRAYINPVGITKEVTSANASLVKGIVLGTDAPADGIRSTKVTKGAQGVAFDLQGRPAARPLHGHTYLINGHKVYIK